VILTLPPAPFVPEALVGTPGILVNAAWIGDGAPSLGEVVALGGDPAGGWAGRTTYCALQSLVDPFAPHGRANHARSEWMGDVSPDTAAALRDLADAMTTPHGQIVIHQMGGVASRVHAGATAFSRRDAPLMMLVNAAWEPGGDPEPHRRWVGRVWEAVLPDSAGGAYVNHLGQEGAGRVRAAYGVSTYRRLEALKARMDPGNVLRRNQNVPPPRDG
jgi:FAD/FMN-containing dehydrogenase